MEESTNNGKPILKVHRNGSMAVSTVRALLSLFQWIVIIAGAVIAILGVIQGEMLPGIIGVALMVLSYLTFAPLKALIIGFQAIVEAAEDTAAEKEQQYNIIDE